MLPLFGNNLLFLPSRCSSSSSQIPNLLFRFAVLGFSSSSSSSSSCHTPLPPPPQPYYNQHNQDKVRVSVWWDFDTCGIPSGFDVSKVAPSVRRALKTNGINGPVDFRAYGDVSQFSKFEQTALSSTGINLCHITDEMKKNEKRKKARQYLFFDLIQWWFWENSPPFHLFIICGDVGLNNISLLHSARMWNYNILVACPGMTCDVLRGATAIMWDWSSILKGEDLTGKHFNPFGSWYGDSKVPLEPFSAAEEPTSTYLPMAELLNPSKDIKFGESISRLVKKVSSSYPNGISIGDLRAELAKCDVPLGKPFYGHKKFSNFLVSIPHVQLQYLGEGKFHVHLIPSTTSAVRDDTSTQKLHSEGKNMDRS